MLEDWIPQSAMTFVGELLQLQPQMLYPIELEGDSIGIQASDINASLTDLQIVFNHVKDNNTPFITQVDGVYYIVLPILDDDIFNLEGHLNITELKNRISNFEHVIVHEFTHYLDQVECEQSSSTDRDEYLNDMNEVRAFLAQALSALNSYCRCDHRRSLMNLNTYEDFLSFMMTQIFPHAFDNNEWFDHLNRENQSYVCKTLNQTYKYFKTNQ